MKSDDYNLLMKTRLREAGLRPTNQRLALSQILFSRGNRHITAERLHMEAQDQGIRVSQATVYNTLHQFTSAGLLREVIVDSSRSYFDTNMGHHHHFFIEDEGRLVDIDGDDVEISGLPTAPAGHSIEGIDIIVRLSASNR